MSFNWFSLLENLALTFNSLIWLSHFHYSLSQVFVPFCFCFLLLFSFIYYFHYLWHLLSASFTAIISLCYYFISQQHTLYYTFPFDLLFWWYLTLVIGNFYCLNYLSLLLHLIISYLVNTFLKNYVINIWTRQLLWFI